MSRYDARLKNNRILSWGYDEPLREYFLHEEYSPEEIKKLVSKAPIHEVCTEA